MIPWGLCRVPRGEIPEQKTDAHIGGVWYTISRNQMTYNSTGKRITSENLAGQVTTTAWDCCFAYANNTRSELTNAVAAVDSDCRYAYDFDDIGNRLTASERGTNSVYIANQLDQYTVVDDFTPQFDDDGNQTLIKTATGIWFVTYNGENRPILWTSGDNTIYMSFDRMGRRVTKNAQRFVYDGYLQIADNNGNAYIWDPTEPVATRPLAWNRNSAVSYYVHDGNKNVSEVVAADGALAAHYEYAPFGAVSVQCGASAMANPWCFSSEYAENETATVYYNYRHYEPMAGRWLSRDPIEETAGYDLYAMCLGNSVSYFDVHGLSVQINELSVHVRLDWPEKPPYSPDNKYLFDDLGEFLEEAPVVHNVFTGEEQKLSYETMGYTDFALFTSVVCECVPKDGYWRPFHGSVTIRPNIHIRKWFVDGQWWNSTIKDEMDHVNDLKAWVGEGLEISTNGPVKIASARSAGEDFLKEQRRKLERNILGVRSKNTTKEACEKFQQQLFDAALLDSLSLVIAKSKNTYDDTGKHSARGYPKEDHWKMSDQRKRGKTKGGVK